MARVEERWVDNLFDEDSDELADDDLEHQCVSEQMLQESGRRHTRKNSE